MPEEMIPSCCEYCGGMVEKKRMLTGAKYSVPVSDEAMFIAAGINPQIDFFIYDRLLRAERIINDLRRQVDELASEIGVIPRAGN